MTAPSHIAARRKEALTEPTAILERHDPEATTHLAKTNHGGGIPSPTKKPLENATYLANPCSSSRRSWTGSLRRRSGAGLARRVSSMISESR